MESLCFRSGCFVDYQNRSYENSGQSTLGRARRHLQVAGMVRCQALCWSSRLLLKQQPQRIATVTGFSSSSVLTGRSICTCGSLGDLRSALTCNLSQT